MQNDTRRRRTLRTTLAATAVIVAAVLLASCSSTENSRDRSAGSSSSAQRARLDAAQCLRDKGYDVPDPGSEDAEVAVPEGADPDRYLQDSAACDAAAGLDGAAADAEEPESLTAAVAPQIAECMRDAGYPDFPEDEDAIGAFQNHADDPEAVGTALQTCTAKSLPDGAVGG